MFNFTERLKAGLARSREALSEIFYMGACVDDDFWDDLEDRLVMADVGAELTARICDDLRDLAAQKGYTQAAQIQQALIDRLAQEFYTIDYDMFSTYPGCIVFVGINGAGKTTTVGKLAFVCKESGHSCLIGGADTFRAAAIEQLDVWGKRAGVRVVTRERGNDPASICYDVLEEAAAQSTDLVLIDTAGRLHTSIDLMKELQKVVAISRKRASMPVKIVLVLDATCGQNGLVQAQQFHESLSLDGIIVTKLDGTAKGGIALRISHDLKLPIVRCGVGEQIEDLQRFDPYEFCAALVGTSEGEK